MSTKKHKTADPKSIAIATPPPKVSLGMVASELNGPRPDLNGLRVKSPAGPEIYLIDGGLKRHIPNPDTYNNLFRDWNGVVIDIDINEIPTGTSISDGAVLMRASNGSAVYLVDQGVKRHVASPAIMDKYYFAWGKVCNVPHVLVDFIKEGTAIDS